MLNGRLNTVSRCEIGTLVRKDHNQKVALARQLYLGKHSPLANSRRQLKVGVILT